MQSTTYVSNAMYKMSWCAIDQVWKHDKYLIENMEIEHEQGQSHK